MVSSYFKEDSLIVKLSVLHHCLNGRNDNMLKFHKYLCLCVFTGSENNSLYLYYKGLSKTLLTFKFDTVKSVLDKDKKEDDTNEFVSAVCWRALPDGVSSPLYSVTLSLTTL